MRSRPAVPEARSPSSVSASSSLLGHGVRVPEQEATGGGQGDRPWPAGPVEERLADGSLQAGDLLADGRLRVAQDVGRADEGPLLGHRAQCPQVPQLHVLEWHKHKSR